jgi:hypothetical protein
MTQASLTYPISPLTDCVIPTGAAKPRSGGICFSTPNAGPAKIRFTKERH